MTRVFISPQPSQTKDDNGVGRVVLAQHRYLPEHGIELVGSVEQAEVVVAHIIKGTLPYVDALCCHGAYWTGDVDSGEYTSWHHNANAMILATAREARAITVPSTWVAMPFKRDMRITPTVIGHGIEANDWQPRPNQGYVLWNKNRAADACSPLPVWELASRGVDVVSTFATPQEGKAAPKTLRVIGTQPHAIMKEWIQAADVYLATTKETFGIGTLEAMASGVPILGYAWGGTLDIVEHGVTGWLVEPGDIDGLLEGLEILRNNRARYSQAAREAAKAHSWQAVMSKYADLFRQVAEEKREEGKRRGVSVVITNYNYGHHVKAAIDSCLAQRVLPDEIIVVDDGSTDHSKAVISSFGDKIKALYGANQGVAAARNAGIAVATQEHIICLDADDTLDSRYIKTLLPAMQRDRALGVAYTGITLTWENGNRSQAQWPPEFNWESQAQPTNPPSNCIPCAAMFRKDMWRRAGGYVQHWAPGEDTEFFTRGLSTGFNAKRVTEEGLFNYRLHGGSASRTKTYKAIDSGHPWLRDKHFPMAAPAKNPPLVRSYSAPAVSVIIPVGPGHERLLTQALDSLLAQTCRNWEAVVINDSGSDLDDILTPYPFVTLVETTGKNGAGKARNLGIESAKAALVLFLDADDWLLPNALEKMLKKHAKTGDYVYSGWIILDDEGEHPVKAPAYNQEGWLDKEQHKGKHAVTALIPTEWCKAVGGFDETMAGWEDWDFFIKLAINGYCGTPVPDSLLVYRLHAGTRRRESFQQKAKLLALLDERYSEYRTGAKTMCGCGSNGASKTIIAARKALTGVAIMANEQTEISQASEPEAVTPPQSNYVRLEYIGAKDGAVTYAGGGGRSYRAGRNPANRFVDVHKDDVEKLANLSVFRVVQRSQGSSAAQAQAAELPQEPKRELTQEELAERLEIAKANASKELAGLDVMVKDAPKPKGRPKGTGAKVKGTKAK